jgi:hypothetical protein
VFLVEFIFVYFVLFLSRTPFGFSLSHLQGMLRNIVHRVRMMQVIPIVLIQELSIIAIVLHLGRRNGRRASSFFPCASKFGMILE